MGPKNKKEKKKGGKKKEEKIVKMTKSQYLAKIAENNAILAQMRKNREVVETLYLSTEKKYEQLQEDMADIIKYLQHEIEDNEDEIEEYNEKISMLQNDMNEQDKYYESILHAMEREFEDKKRELLHKIELVRSKIMAAEDIRQQRVEYIKRKEDIFKKIRQMEARHEQELYEAEKSVIVKQDAMQKDMETHLATLATDFKQATDFAIGETTNKLIKDNIVLGNTLTCMQESIEKARVSYQKAHEMARMHRFKAELIDEEHSVILQKYSLQTNNVDGLIRSLEELTERITAGQKLIKDNRRLQRHIAEKECILKEKTEQFNTLSKISEQSEEQLNSAKESFSVIRKNIVKLQLSLYETAKKVKEAIDIEHMQLPKEKSVEEDTETEDNEEILKELKFKNREATMEEITRKITNVLLSDTHKNYFSGSSSSVFSKAESDISELSNGLEDFLGEG